MNAEFPKNPYDLFKIWLLEAEKKEPSYPTAMALATVDTHGKPAVRIVLMRHYGDNGFEFFTNYESNKGQALDATQHAEANFYWKSTEKQIRISGNVERLSADQSDTYFNNRPRASRIGAWASRQSHTMENYAELSQAFETYEEKFSEHENPPRPSHWGGYRIVPSTIEFWQEQPYRLHKRVIYSQHEAGKWTLNWLYP